MPEPKQPNILLVTTDQQRFDACGAPAPSFLRTPHFDNIAREGITFTSAYADCPICVPARVGIMTGQFVTTHGMYGNGSSSSVMGREGTLASLMREAGYQTAAIGKMHWTPQRARHGFDEMVLPEDYYRQMARSGQPVQPMHHGLGQNELYPGMATVPEAMTLTSWTAEQCVEYIRERRDPTAPFFLWCSFSKPHPPFDPPEPYYSMYRDADIPDPVRGDWAGDDAPEAFKRFREQWSLDQVPPEVIRAARAAYYGLVTQIDYNMGRVFAALQDMGMFEDTLVLYTSDHGEYLGDHGTGAKVFFHEPSAHVPFVLRLPKSWDDRRHGTQVGTPVTHADVAPTLLAAAGAPIPGEMDGQDLTAVARGRVEPREFVFGTVHGSTWPGPMVRDYLGITDGRWKYIWWPEGPAEQLFDLATDPRETANLAGREEHEAERVRMQKALVDWTAEHMPDGLADGRLIQWEPTEETEVDRRNRAWPGYHTEFYDVDVRH